MLQETIANQAIAKPRLAQQPKVRLAKRLQRIVVYVLLVLGAVIFLLPLMCMVSTSLKPSQAVFTFPRELDDAARIEGASHLRILTSIILPLSKPALATVAIFAFLGNWNNLLSPLIYLRSTDKFTLALGLNFFNGQYVTYYNQLMAV